MRPSKVMSKAFKAAFQRLDQRARPLPVGSRLVMVRYRIFNADCSVGKWPRALTARRNRALRLSIVILSPLSPRARNLRVHVVDGVRDASPQVVGGAVRAA